MIKDECLSAISNTLCGGAKAEDVGRYWGQVFPQMPS